MKTNADDNALFTRAQGLLAGGVTSNVRLLEKPHPIYVRRAHGSRIVDQQGHEFLDFVCGYGTVLLGHNPGKVLRAVTKSLESGQITASNHHLEIELAEMLRAMIPTMELVRFSSSGSEAIHAALRVARAFTGRRKIIRFEGHYHGWLDNQLVGYRAPLNRNPLDGQPTPAIESAGIPPGAVEDLVVIPWNDADLLENALDQHRGQVAAVIMEPIMANAGCIEPKPGYVERVRSLCDEHEVLLIFDEIITGFRVAMDGAQGLLKVNPDLSVFGKAMGSGFPISAFGGRRDVMEMLATGAVNHSGTYNGNFVSTVAAHATLEVLRSAGASFYASLRRTGQRLMQRIREAAARTGVSVLIQGPGPVFWLWFTDRVRMDDYRQTMEADYAAYDRFTIKMLQRGVRLMPQGRWYVSAAHTDSDIDQAGEAVEECLRS